MTCVCGKESWFVEPDKDLICCEYCSAPLPEKVVRRVAYDDQRFIFTEHHMFVGRKFCTHLVSDMKPVEWPDELPKDYKL